jgi:phosphomethylpyrimidine synthase
MEITQQLRDYARSRGLEVERAADAGLDEKAAEFRREGEIYLPATTGERVER